MKHTQGNWKVSHEPFTLLVLSEKEKSVCQINKYSLSEEEAEANAQLIAAAPELFEALKRLLNVDYNAVDITERIQAEAQAKEALAKARGW